MLPNANNLDGFVTKGSLYDQFDRTNHEPGTAVFQYPNTQRATTLWFHDHTLGMTRTNVYAGPSGFYLLRGGSSDLPPGVLPSGKYEVPLVVQDRSFNADGSLFFPDSRAFFDGFARAVHPFSDVAPIHNPEFFGNTMVVNGKTWPLMQVEQRRYRFRILNACNARMVILKLVAKNPGAKRCQRPDRAAHLADRLGWRLPAGTGETGVRRAKPTAHYPGGTGRCHHRLLRLPGGHRTLPGQRGAG